MALSDLAFKTSFKPYYKLVILGQTIDSELIKSVSPLNAELDYPALTTFNIGNVSITLFDPDGDFNPNNTQNFWTDNWARMDIPEHYNQVGFKGNVEIHLGYDRDGTIESEKLFDGEVANIRVNLQPPEVIIQAVDTSQSLRPAKIFDFGIQRKVILNEGESTTAVGRYPFPPSSIPSEQSISAVTSIDATEMTDVGTVGIEGIANPLNYQIENNAIETEGGALWSPNKPLATFRDIYRYKRIDTLIKKLLDHYDITDYEIDIPDLIDRNRHFASHGRPGWDIENLSSGLARQWDWDGYIKDVVYDSTNKRYYMLYGQQSNAIADYLISYDVETDEWERVATTNITISSAPYEYEMWQLASDDFDEFYILATVHRLTGDDDDLVRGTYDTLESSTTSEIRILKYVQSTDTWSIVDDRSGERPQIGFWYSAFALPNIVGALGFQMLPDNRHGFVIKEINSNTELVYRGASGIQTYRLSNGTKATLKTIAEAHQRSMDFWIGDDADTTFFAWIEQDSDNAVLRVDDGNGDEIVNESYDNTDNPFFEAGEYCEIITISDMIHDSGSLYMVLQIKDGTQKRDESEGQLIHIDVSSGDISGVKHYSQFTRAARSPVVHDSEVYYFEGSHYQYQEHAERIERGANITNPQGDIIPNSGSVTQVIDSELYPDDTGHLIRMDGDEAIDFGLCWRSASLNPLENDADLGFGQHGGTASPLISDGNAIHLWTGYGDLTKLNDAPVSNINNWHWLQYGTQVPQRIPTFPTNGKQVWGLLNELARITNSTLSYRKEKFSFLPRKTIQTKVRLNLSDTATANVAVVDASAFPNSGQVLINNELIAYTTKSADNSDLELLTRAEENSQADTHNRGDTVLFVDALVFNHPDKQNLGSLRFTPDFLGIYNQLTGNLTPIGGEKAEIYVDDTDSVTANGAKPRDFDFALMSAHDRPWAKMLLNQYLVEMQQAQFQVNLELPWSPHLQLGQTLVVDQQVVAHLRWTPVRILRISHDFSTRTTRITGRTFGERRISATVLRFDDSVQAHRFYTVNEAITAFTLPEAEGGVGTITYSLTSLETGLSFSASSRQVTGTPTDTSTRIMTYTAEDASTVPQNASLKFRITIVDELTFADIRPDNLVFEEGCFIQHQLDKATGGVLPLQYRIGGLPDVITFNPRTRKLTGIMPSRTSDIEFKGTDAAGNETAQNFDLVGDSTPTWRAILITEVTENSKTFDEIMALDGDSGQARTFKDDGTRRRTDGQPNGFDIALGTGTWRGATATSDRKIFVNNAGSVKFYDYDNDEQSSEALSLGTGNWQDVALIGSNRLGFLDQDAAAIRMYGTDRTRQATEDIEFGFNAEFRSIASNATGTKIFVLVENLGTLLVWDTSDTNEEFKDNEAFEIVEGTTDWQAITRHADGHLLLIHKNATRAIAFSTTGTRDRTKDLKIR